MDKLPSTFPSGNGGICTNQPLYIPSDCQVTPDISITDTKEFNKTFWASNKINEKGIFLTVRLHESLDKSVSIMCTHTHVNTTEISRKGNNILSSDKFSWPACPEWRQFNIALDHTNKLSINDIDNNKTWTTSKSSFI